MVPLQKKREAVFQILFSLSLAKGEQEEIETLISKELKISKQSANGAFKRALQILESAEKIDLLLAEVANAYDFSRISLVEKAVLRLGAYEILLDRDIPYRVAISEAVRLTRKFSSPQAADFVNALLDAIYKKSVGLAVEEQSREELGVEETTEESTDGC